MARSREQVFTAVVTEGALLPSDLLVRVVAGDGELGGVTPAAYHLGEHERLTEAITHSWSRVLGAWSAFRAAASKLPESEAGTTVTRERWLLPLFQELGYGRLPTTRAIEVEGKAYPVSHTWDHSPVHLVSFRYELDRRTPGAAGAARTSPHGLVQEFLNRSDEHLWGFVSNGLQLRILRDHLSLTRQAYVEFDLETMMDEEVYSDFVLLWLLCHQSRVEVKDGSRPEECWLEQWSEAARKQGTRALEHLRSGVERSIEALGVGFLAHPANEALREALREGELTTQDYYRELLRLVYRLLFLFVSEDRGLLLMPEATVGAKDRYGRFYSTARLRRLASHRRGTKHPDLYRALVVVMEKLGSDDGCPKLGLPALGSYLWSKGALAHLHGADIANHDLLDAMRALALTTEGGVRRTVDYKNLGAEELGSVYESLLELHPTVDTDAAVFSLDVGGGSERKTTGSYYTPTSLIHCLLDSALDPVLEEAAGKENPEQAILALKVCDPASGSGHFLIAAAHRIARKLASVRTGDEEPAPEAWRKALRDVIGHCIYAVDLNPMAVELCKVSLWMEALEPGKPLSFLDHRILCGNSLLGTTPALLDKGIPDDAFKPIEGDDKKVVSALRKQNKQERKGQITFFGQMAAETTATYGSLAGRVESLEGIDDTSIEGIHQKEQALRGYAESDEYRRARLVADAWCAAFVWRKDGAEPAPITEQVFRTLQKSPESVPQGVHDEVDRLKDEYHFFHWHLAFPDVFSVPTDGTPDNEHTGWDGGFDVVLGNPPWERIKLQEKEFFATKDPEIAGASTAAKRGVLIRALEFKDPLLLEAFRSAIRLSEGCSHYVRDSRRFPLCGRGDINTYSVFAETYRGLLDPRGRAGCVVPSGIAFDDTTRFFFQDLIEKSQLTSLLSFWEVRRFFPGTDSRLPFCLLTVGGPDLRAARSDFVFDARSISELNIPDRHFSLSVDEIALLNPNTRTCPVFGTERDARLTKQIYGRIPVLLRDIAPREDPWLTTFMAMFHMANDSDLFRTQDELLGSGAVLDGSTFHLGSDFFEPLYEAKMVHHYDHRFGDFSDHPPSSKSSQLPDVPIERKQNPEYRIQPRYWVERSEVENRLRGWPSPYVIGWRDITNAASERTTVAAVVPRVACGDTFLLLLSGIEDAAVPLLSNLNSFVLDYVSRQKIGGNHLKYHVMKQLPILPPATFKAKCTWDLDWTVERWLRPRVLELVYTSWDLKEFAREQGYLGAPFGWNADRRSHIRCEIEAAFFLLYGIGIDDADYILETFPLVKRRDLGTYGEYRTKCTVLEVMEVMSQAAASGIPFVGVLKPPAGTELSLK